MVRPISTDLRERLILAVQRDGISARAAAARFGVSVSSSVKWVQRHRATGSVAPSKIGGHKPNTLSAHSDWLISRTQTDFTLRGLVTELADRDVKVAYVQVWRFVHANGLSFKKNAFYPPNSSAQRSPGDASNGRNIRDRLIPDGSYSLMRPGQRPTWPPCAAGQPRASASMPKSPMAIGKP